MFASRQILMASLMTLILAIWFSFLATLSVPNHTDLLQVGEPR
jgi:hypothetical protein